jgi:hypothetical protein
MPLSGRARTRWEGLDIISFSEWVLSQSY